MPWKDVKLDCGGGGSDTQTLELNKRRINTFKYSLQNLDTVAMANFGAQMVQAASIISREDWGDRAYLSQDINHGKDDLAQWDLTQQDGEIDEIDLSGIVAEQVALANQTLAIMEEDLHALNKLFNDAAPHFEAAGWEAVFGSDPNYPWQRKMMGYLAGAFTIITSQWCPHSAFLGITIHPAHADDLPEVKQYLSDVADMAAALFRLKQTFVNWGTNASTMGAQAVIQDAANFGSNLNEIGISAKGWDSGSNS